MAYTNETLPKTEFESNIQRPAMMKIGNKNFVVPLWLEVSSDFDLEKALNDGLIVNTMEYKPVVKENEWPIEGSTGNLYTVKLLDDSSFSCDCMGFRRAKDGKCKHIKQVIAENC